MRGGAKRWTWVFAVLAGFPGLPAPAIKCFHDQLYGWICEHKLFPHVQLKPVVCLA